MTTRNIITEFQLKLIFDNAIILWLLIQWVDSGVYRFFYLRYDSLWLIFIYIFYKLFWLFFETGGIFIYLTRILSINALNVSCFFTYSSLYNSGKSSGFKVCCDTTLPLKFSTCWFISFSSPLSGTIIQPSNYQLNEMLCFITIVSPVILFLPT